MRFAERVYHQSNANVVKSKLYANSTIYRFKHVLHFINTYYTGGITSTRMESQDEQCIICFSNKRETEIHRLRMIAHFAQALYMHTQVGCI